MPTDSTPELTGLVLAGGLSRRMRTDKGSLEIHGRSQAEHCLQLVAPFCVAAFVSVRAEQAGVDPIDRALAYIEERVDP